MSNPTLEDIVIERYIPASRERVFKALTDAGDIMAWHHASEGWTTPSAELDLRVGGEYRIAYRSPDESQSFMLEGVYKEIMSPSRLVHTLGPDRLVTFDLSEEGDKTKVVLAFTPETENSRELQVQGWSAIMDNLVAHLS